MACPQWHRKDTDASQDVYDLDRDDPEGRRIAAAVIRNSRDRLDTHGAAEASEARGRNLHSSHVPSVARGDSSLEKYSYSRVKSTPVKTTTEEDGDLIIIIPCGSHSSPLDTVHPTKCATLSMCNQQEEAEAASNVSKGLFWEELESLKEENLLLREESEIWRVKGSTEALKLQLQNFSCCVLHTTAFGCHGVHVDETIHQLLTNAYHEAEAAVKAILDIPVVLMRWDPVVSLIFQESAVKLCSQKNFNVSASYSTETIRGYPSFPDAEHPGASTDCVVVAMSREKMFKSPYLTTLVAENGRLAGFFLTEKEQQSVELDNSEFKRLESWLNELRPVQSQLGNNQLQNPESLISRVACQGASDLLVHLRLSTRTGKEPLERSQIFFTSFFLGHRCYVLGVHPARITTKTEVYGRACSLPPRSRLSASFSKSKEQRDRMTEISLRWDAYKVLMKTLQSAAAVLKLACVVLEESNVLRSIPTPRQTT